MSLCENVSELARELRTAAGTVLTIVGSRLEADARARVDEVGPQWLTEFEEQRDSLEPADMCQFHGQWCAGEASWCHHLEDSAADTAADPSPATTTGCSRAGAEGPEGASAIPSAAPSGHLADAWYCHDCGVLNLVQALTDPGEVSAPSPGELVREDDLAAHIMGDFVSGQEVDPLTATLIDALSSRIASALLTDFTIIRRA